MKHFFVALLLLAGYQSFAQKPVIDTSLFAGNPNIWPALGYGSIMSNDGAYVAYTISEDGPVENRTLIIKSLVKVWEKELGGGESCVFSADSKFAVIKLAGDSLCIRALGRDEVQYIPRVLSYQLSDDSKNSHLVYLENTAERSLVIRDMINGKTQQLPGVMSYQMSKNGQNLVIQKNEAADGQNAQLQWMDLRTGRSRTIWQGAIAKELLFNPQGDGILFTSAEEGGGQSRTKIWYCDSVMEKAELLVDEKSYGIDTNLAIASRSSSFSKDGSKVFFTLVEKNVPHANPNAIQVDVWNYKDGNLQSDQLQGIDNGSPVPRQFTAVVGLSDKRVFRLQNIDEGIIPYYKDQYIDEERVLVAAKGCGSEWWWNKNARSAIYLISSHDASRVLLKKDAMPDITQAKFSPSGRFVVYFNAEEKAYFSYDRVAKVTKNITRSIPVSLMQDALGYSGEPTPGLLGPFLPPCGIAGWLENEKSILIYDAYDIWKVDPSGIAPPVNITHDYGRSHHIRFRIREDIPFENRIFSPHAVLMLSAFDENSKYHGFYRQVIDGKGDPELLSMGPWNFSFLTKAKNAAVWTMIRMSVTDYPNVYMTRDFKTFTALTNLAPQKKYNWLTAELMHFKSGDGKRCDAILYKPEDFDPEKKYPVIVNYYEKRSDELYDYLEPRAIYGDINIPYFVSRGYLVFVPDIHFKIGSPGESALDCVTSGVSYLTQLSFVDSLRMGIYGVSYGGFETNYLVTHTHQFAAAAEMCGPTDCISAYNGLMYGYGGARGSSEQFHYETAQSRIGASLWQRPDLYIKNSPIMSAGQVTTPLLMTHCEKDGSVSFGQAVEFFTGLRRSGKKVWLLQYDIGGHALGGKSIMDYTVRLTQFFDHYLKDAPAPIWMTEGIPARLKGIETGLGLDTSGKQP